MTKKRIFSALVLALLALTATAASWVGEAQDSVFVVQAFAKAAKAKPQCPSLFFARLFLDRPYVAHTLEVADDRRVVINTRQLDCTTLVENVAALTLCLQAGKTTFADFVETLRLLRYRQGRMDGYTSRLHYFTDWIEDNTAMGFVTERQQPRPPFSAVQTVKVGYMTAHPKSYKALREHPEYIPVIAKTEKALNGMTYRYIPKAKIKNTKLLRSTIKDGDIIAITCNKAGLDIAHLGIAVWHSDGLHLLNASMIHHKVVEESKTFYAYLQEHKSHTGVRVLSFEF